MRAEAGKELGFFFLFFPFFLEMLRIFVDLNAASEIPKIKRYF